MGETEFPSQRFREGNRNSQVDFGTDCVVADLQCCGRGGRDGGCVIIMNKFVVIILKLHEMRAEIFRGGAAANS